MHRIDASLPHVIQPLHLPLELLKTSLANEGAAAGPVTQLIYEKINSLGNRPRDGDGDIPHINTHQDTVLDDANRSNYQPPTVISNYP